MSTDICVCSRYSGATFAFYGSNGSISPVNLTNTGSVGHFDGFVSKYSKEGNTLWAAKVNGEMNGCAMDMSGNVYVTGGFRDSSLNIYNANGTLSSLPRLQNMGSSDVFIIKYDTNGTALWATKLGSDNTELGVRISIDMNGNVYATGIYLSNSFNIYDADGTTTHLPGLQNTGSNIRDVFLVKYNTNGYAQWGTRLGGDTISYIYGISVDINANVYLTGVYEDTSFNIYDANGSTAHLPGLQNTGSNTQNTFIVKYNTNGYAQWGTRLGGNRTSIGLSISVDLNGNVYASGLYDDTTSNIYDADGSTSHLPGLQNTGINAQYTFVVKYNTNGYAQWGTRLGGDTSSGGSGGTSISVDLNGNIYVNGFYYDNSFNIYDANGSISNLPGLQNTGDNLLNTFLVKYNTNGYAKWGTRLGGNTLSSMMSMSVDVNSNVYVTGYYQDTSLNIYDANGSTSHLPSLQNIGSNLTCIFIIKYDADGYAQWATRMGDTNSNNFYIMTLANNQFYVPDPNGPNVCFPAGTLIQTDQGEVPIEHIIAYRHTISNKKIIGLVKTHNLEKKLVQFDANALGQNYPSKTILISKEHKIQYKGKMIEAKHFVGYFGDKVREVFALDKVLYNVLLKKHDKMSVHGLTVETLHPSNLSAKYYIKNHRKVSL